MRIPSRDYHQRLRFDITPLIDIVVQLIIFFLVASHFVRNENVEAVTLPEATQHEADHEESPRRLVVTVTADRTMHVAGKAVDLLAVEQMIVAGREADPNRFEVRIRGDRSVPYELIEPIMIACARAGVTDVKFAVTGE